MKQLQRYGCVDLLARLKSYEADLKGISFELMIELFFRYIIHLELGCRKIGDGVASYVSFLYRFSV